MKTKIEVTNEELVRIYEGLGTITNSREKLKVKLRCLISKNIQLLEADYKSIQDGRQGDKIPGYNEYVTEERKLRAQKLPTDELEKALWDLRDEHADAVKAADEMLLEFAALLKEQTEIEVAMIDESLFPEDTSINIHPISKLIKFEGN
jgi:hypothetical protein